MPITIDLSVTFRVFSLNEALSIPLLPIHDTRFPIYDSRFPIHDTRFPIYDLRFTIHDSRFATESASALMRFCRS